MISIVDLSSRISSFGRNWPWPRLSLSALGLLGLLGAGALSAQISWDHAFSSEDANFAGLEAASFFIPEAEGYVLLGDDPGGQGQGIVRFDRNGNEIWNAWLEVATAEPDSVTIAPDWDNANRFFATYYTPADTTIHVGLFNAADQTPVFAHSLVAETDFDRLDTFPLPNSRGALAQALDDAIEVLVLNDSGAVVFHQQYASSTFADLDTAQSVSIAFEPFDSGYVLIVERTGTPITDPLTFMTSYPREISVVHLNATGGVIGATSFEDASANPIPPFFTVLPSGAVIAAISDFTLDTGTFAITNTIRYLRIGADRSLEWSFGLAGAALYGLRTKPSLGELYLGGSINVADSENDETDAVFARLDLATGNLLGTARIDLQPYDTGFVSEVTADAVYATLTGSDLSGAIESTVVKLDRSLATAIGLTYTGPHDYGFATFDSDTETVVLAVTDGAVTRAVSLSPDLQSSLDCPDLTTTAVITLETALTPTNFAPTLTTTTVSATTQTATFGPTTFPFASLEYTATPGFCVEGSTGSGSESDPQLVLEDGDWVLKIPSEVGTSYLIYTSTDLQTFLPVNSLFGDGTVLEFPVTPPADGAFFVQVVPLSF